MPLSPKFVSEPVSTRPKHDWTCEGESSPRASIAMGAPRSGEQTGEDNHQGAITRHPGPQGTGTPRSGAGTRVITEPAGINLQRDPGPQGGKDSIAAKTPRKPPHISLSAQSNAALFQGKRGRPKLTTEPGQVFENSTLICNIIRSPEKRAKIITQLQRLRYDRKRRYDPRNAARLLSQRLHYPQIAVELVIQGQSGEMEIWLREYRAVRTRAEAAIAQYWMGRVA